MINNESNSNVSRTELPQSIEANAALVRRKTIQSYPHPILEPKHLEGAILLPTRIYLIREMKKDSVVCEIGVANGDFSEEILKHSQPRKLHLIDSWHSQRYSPDQDRVRNRFKKELANGIIEINLGLSIERLSDFPDNYFDWIYIDTVHDYRVTSEELAIGMLKVKPGGIICGHDYTPGNIINGIPYGVVNAVQEFCVKYNWKIVYLTCECNCYNSFAVTEISPSS